MRSEVNKIMDASYGVTDETKIASMVKLHADLVERGSKGEVKPIIEAAFYRNILNKAGYFYLNGDKYQVTKENVTITYNNTLTRSTPKTHSFSYYEGPAYTRASPGITKRTGLEGCVSGGGKNISGTYQDIVFETKYRVYKNELYPAAISSYYERFVGSHTFITYYIDHYVQIEAWQWKHDTWNNVWSYYRPNYQLVLKNMQCTIKDSKKTIGNVMGGSGEYYTTHTIDMGTIQYETIPLNQSQTWKDQPTIPLEYLYYEVNNFEPGYNYLQLSYQRPY